MYPFGYDTVGLSLSSITNALNPVNHLKAAYGVVTNPFNPLKQTQAMLNLFRPSGGSSRPAPQPPPQYLPPGAYTPQAQQQQQWGAMPPGYGAAPPPAYAPPGYAPPPYAPAPGGGWTATPTPTGMAPPSQFGQPFMFDYAAPLPVDVNALYGPQTGWDASYGGGSGDVPSAWW